MEAALVLYMGDLVVVGEVVVCLDGSPQGVLFPGDVAAGVAGAGEGPVQAVAVGGGVAEGVVFLVAQAFRRVLEQQDAAVGLGQFLQGAAVSAVGVAADAAARVGDAGGFAATAWPGVGGGGLHVYRFIRRKALRFSALRGLLR